MTFKPPTGSPRGARKVMTVKQIDSHRRNWSICQLRAFFHMIPLCVRPGTREQIERLVDAELLRLNAESEIVRQQERERELEQGYGG